MFSTLILGLLVLGAVLWFLLDRRENRRVLSGNPRHSGLRLIFAAAALLTMLFTGGCALLFAASMADSSGSGIYVDLPLILIISGPPFAAGLLVWWLAMRRKAG